MVVCFRWNRQTKARTSLRQTSQGKRCTPVRHRGIYDNIFLVLIVLPPCYFFNAKSDLSLASFAGNSKDGEWSRLPEGTGTQKQGKDSEGLGLPASLSLQASPKPGCSSKVLLFLLQKRLNAADDCVFLLLFIEIPLSTNCWPWRTENHKVDRNPQIKAHERENLSPLKLKAITNYVHWLRSASHSW